MRKLLVITGAAAAVWAAVASGMGSSRAEPASNSTYNVVGEPYARAVAILRAQGVPTIFGGSVGSAVPQSQCLVKSQKLLSAGKIQLNLDCTEAALPEAPPVTSVATPSDGTQGDGSQTAGNRPTPGAPGIVTVIPTRVG